MQWCTTHWDMLRAEVARQGLSGFVPDTGEAAAKTFTRAANGEDSIDSFDPLMGAMFAMNSFIGDQLGEGGHLAVIMLDGCPICKAEESHRAVCNKECGYSITQFFVNAVADQKEHLEALR